MWRGTETNSAGGSRGGTTVIVVTLCVLMAALSYLVHPLAPLAVLVGFWFLFVGVRSPFFLLICFLVYLIGRLADFIPVLGALGAGKYLALAAFGLLIVAKLVDRDLSFVRSDYNKWLLLLTGAILLSTLLGTNPPIGFDWFFKEFIKTLVLFFLIVNLVTTPKHVVIFQICLGVICSALGGYALLAQLLGRDPLTGAAMVEGSRAAGVGALVDPNDVAMVMLMATPFWLVALITVKGWRRWLFVLLFLLGVGGVLATQSRGGILGLTAGFGLIASRYIKNKVVLGTTAAFFLAVVVAVAGISGRSSGGDMENIDSSAQGRLDAWQAGGRMLVRHPLAGVGFLQFPDNYAAYAPGTSRWHRIATHNSYIQVASETGLFGFIPFMMLVYLSLRHAVRFGRDGPEKSSTILDAVRASAAPCLVALLSAAFFLSNGWAAYLYILFAYGAATANVFNLDEAE
jgi:putative inorganic carbon (hco3(-)) transporter